MANIYVQTYHGDTLYFEDAEVAGDPDAKTFEIHRGGEIIAEFNWDLTALWTTQLETPLFWGATGLGTSGLE